MSEKIEINVSADPFSIIPNYIIHDVTMCIEAKMTWIYLFSRRHIKNWSVNPRDVQKMCGFGDRGWRRASKQLREYGYLTETYTQKGSLLKFVWDWHYKHTPKPGLELIVDNSVDNM